jgi:HK97 family phage major capsid protein
MPPAPDYIRRNARRGLEYYEEGFAGDGLRPATVRAARRIAAGEVPYDKLRLMAPWFARHRPDLDSPSARAFLAGDSPRPTAGQTAWLLWGGSISGDVMAAARWAERETEKLERSTAPNYRMVTSPNRAAVDAAVTSTSPAPERNHPPKHEGKTVNLLQKLVQERAELSETVEGILERAAEEGRDLADTEDKTLGELKTRADELDTRISELREVQVKALEAAKLRAEIQADDDQPEQRSAAGVVRVTDEVRTYEPRSKHSFFQDIVAANRYGDAGAQQRLARHAGEVELEERAGSTSNYAGLVIPQYLVEQYSAFAKSGRPFANAVRSLTLPGDGMSVNLSRVTTSTSATVQAAEGDAASDTTLDDTLLTLNVFTVSSAQVLSLQALERGSNVDEVLVEDMASSYATTLDDMLINGSGSSGQPTGVLNTAGIGDIDVDDASPTAAETYVQLVKAIGQVQENYFTGPDLIVMHPRRAAYLAAGLDSSNRPIFQPTVTTAQNVIGTGQFSDYGAPSFSVAGIPVLVDGSIPVDAGAGGDEDRIIVLNTREFLLFEENGGTPQMVRYDANMANLQASMVMYGYAAAGVRNPKAVSVIQGTLLAATL